MTDRELLELAAKAAGVAIEWQPCGWAHDNNTGCEWNPLTADGDALRLAVKLGLRVHKTTSSVEIDIYKDGAWADTVEEKIEHDPLAATRLAIVRAAAKIGRSKE